MMNLLFLLSFSLWAATFECTSVPGVKLTTETKVEFLKLVGNNSYEILKKNLQFSDCARTCFGGADSCSTGESCLAIKEKVRSVLATKASEAKILLLLSQTNLGLVRIDINTVTRIKPEDRIQRSYDSFELTLPNPFRLEPVSESFRREAIQRLQTREKMLSLEFKQKGYKSYNRWLSVKLMEDLEKYRSNYRELIYQELPVLSLLPEKKREGEFSDQDLAKAYARLYQNGSLVRNGIERALKSKTLAFERWNGEALKSWVKELSSPEPDYDLLSFMIFKPQVKNALKQAPQYCSLANELYDEKMSHELQNFGLIIAGSFAINPVLKGVSQIPTKLFQIGRALSGAEVASLTGFSMGAGFLAESFIDVERTKAEVSLGVKDQEELEWAELNRTLNLVFAPTLAPSGWFLGKILYKSYESKMEQLIPELRSKVKPQSELESYARVDLFLQKKTSGDEFTALERKALKSPIAARFLNRLAMRIEKNEPQFFKSETNLNLFLKYAALVSIKGYRTPRLETMAETYFLSLNFHSIQVREKELLSLLESGIKTLELTYANDPKLYLRFNSDARAHELIMLKSLQLAENKSGPLKQLGACLR